MTNESARLRAMDETRARILDVALEILGTNPDAGMSEIASAAGVVRRTVYGYFPTRADLVLTLAQRAVDEMTEVLAAVDAVNGAPERVWVHFVKRIWPLAHRYRVLLALRRGEHGAEIHALLAKVDDTLAGVVERGQAGGVFGRHLPAAALSGIAFSAVFTVADAQLADGSLDAHAAIVTSLLILGVPEARAKSLAGAEAAEG